MGKATVGALGAALCLLGCSSDIPAGVDGTGATNPGAGGSGLSSGGGSPFGTGSTASTGSTTGSGSNSGTGGSGPDGGTSCVPGIPATAQLPRLTNPQYDRTVADLLGVTTLPAANNVPPSALLTPNQAGKMDRQTWDAYQNVASLVAAQAMSDPASQAMFMDCTPSAECLTQTIDTFGRKAFRRPLTQDETTRFQSIITEGADITENGTPEEIAQVLLYAFLVSPSFLTRAEITETDDGNGHFMLSSHEVASRLSFMLTGSSPDQALMDAADQDALQTAEQITAQAQRLMDTDGARRTVEAFHQVYIGADQATSRWRQAEGTGKAPEFTGFSKDLVDLMVQEETMLFEDVVFEQGGTFADLLLTDVAFVTDQTAPFYGLTGSFGTELTKTNLDGSRPGFLTRLGFLANFADYSRGNPILRGAFITKEVIGVDPGAPDPAAAMTKLPEATADLNTNRKRVEAMTANGTCGGCHTPYVNPPGFVLESYDAVGSVQTEESFSGAPIDTVASVIVSKTEPGVTVNNAAEMMELIAHAPGPNRHYAEKMVSVAYERPANNADACIADDLGAQLTSGMSIKDAMAYLAGTESFRVRVVQGN